MNDQLLGYINMAVGLVGIVVSILTAPGMARMVQLQSDGAGKAEVLAQSVKLVGILLVIVTFMFVLALGMILTISPVATSLGAAHPVLVTVLVVAGLFSLAATGAFALADHPLVIPATVGTVELGVMALIAGIFVDQTLFVFAGIVFLVLLLIATLVAGAAEEERKKLITSA